jgi:hypothetical protein
VKLADKISYNLMRFCRGSNSSELIIPNYYLGHYEMDVCRITPAGIVYEYEIKISRSDFKNDLKKGFEGYKKEKGEYVKTQYLKHESLKLGQLNCNRFYYVVPKDLIRIDEVPEYAGLIYWFDKRESFETIKSAPLVKKDKYPIDWHKLALSMAFREQNYKHKYRWEKMEHEQTAKELSNVVKELEKHKRPKTHKDWSQREIIFE